MSDMAILRIGILVAGVLLLAAIFLFGRPKKPSQGRRLEPSERDNARVEPSLASDEAAYITGQVLCVDGGMAV